MDTSADSRKQFYDFAEKVRADYSKCLDNPNLSYEETMKILEQEKDIFKIASDKDTEIRKHEDD